MRSSSSSLKKIHDEVICIPSKKINDEVTVQIYYKTMRYVIYAILTDDFNDHVHIQVRDQVRELIKEQMRNEK